MKKRRAAVIVIDGRNVDMTCDAEVRRLLAKARVPKKEAVTLTSSVRRLLK